MTDRGDEGSQPAPSDTAELVKQILAKAKQQNVTLEQLKSPTRPQPSSSAGRPSGASFEERAKAVKDHAELNRDDHAHESKMRRALGPVLLVTMIFQLLFVDYVISKLGSGGWTISNSVLITYMTSTLVEVIGVATIMVKFYFSEARWKDN